jgi:iron-sulfur cluster insertion protein
MSLPIKITQTAWKKLFDISSKSNNNRFLFSATSGGCNGFNFNLNLMTDNEKVIICKKQTANFISNDDITVYIDPLSELYLLGTTIDYINQDYIKNIFESKFIFNIDKELASACGCGISFTPKI